MNDNDELNDSALNDSALLSAVRDSISGLPMPAAPRLQAITARSRSRRRRRLGGLSIASAGACAALAAGLAGGLAGGSAAGSGSAGPAPQHESPPVDLAAFSVVTGPGGTTTLTLYPRQVINPDAVRRALAEHGIPALVTAGKFCMTADQPGPGIGQVVVLPHRTPRVTGGRPPGWRGSAGPARS